MGTLEALEGSEGADLVVIGAGIASLSCAYNLAKEGGWAPVAACAAGARHSTCRVVLFAHSQSTKV